MHGPVAVAVSSLVLAATMPAAVLQQPVQCPLLPPKSLARVQAWNKCAAAQMC